jgi:RHS repeat-associated protein
VERAYFGAADTNALKLERIRVMKAGVQQRWSTNAYDTAGRLSSVTADSGASATYGYLPNSPLWQTLTFRQGTTNRLTTTRGHDRLNRLQTISSSSSSSSSSPVGVNYLYNDASQRVRATDADGSHWVYEYDALGQVKGGKKYWADGTPVAGQQFTYAHDDIGNRTATGAGGNEVGAALRAASYSVNRLNQYTARTVPSAVDVLGVAASGSTVTVNSQQAYRRGEYFWQELTVINTNAPVATNVTVTAGGTPATGKLVVAPTNQVFLHDLDGNLTDDGVWTYTWDAENRLLGMQHKTTLADTAARRKLAFEYDARGRRIRKQVFPWGSTDYGTTATSDQRFVYDGWNVVGVFDGGLNLQTAYIWGLDLSGTAQGAGGVGGLLAGITGTTAQFAAFDGNGNVRALADGGTGAWSAQYEYGPFGELIRATGPQARANPFRFSTKWHDDESDLLYYGYRYYQPGTGRWINKDPIEEEGGLNLYGFVNGEPINNADNLGQSCVKVRTDKKTCKINVDVEIKLCMPKKYKDYQGGSHTEGNASSINLSSTASRIENSFNLHWNNGGSGRQIGKCDIRFSIKVKVLKRCPLLFGSSVKIVSDPNHRSYVNSQGSCSGTWSDADADWVFAHELGHVMGLPDYYTDQNGVSVPLPGHAGSMMGDYGGSVQDSEIQEILKGKRCPCECP